jgi:phage terminase small subunit
MAFPLPLVNRSGNHLISLDIPGAKMPAAARKLNDRQERFAELVADGVPQAKAYEKAGYAPSRSNAAMLRTNQIVSAHIELLKAAKLAAQQERIDAAARASHVSRQWVLDNLAENAAKGMRSKSASAVANRALELIGKELGMFIERTERGGPGDFSNLSDEELNERLVATLVLRGMREEDARRVIYRTAPPVANEPVANDEEPA